ncbi:hypothetical protein NLN92_18895 [Citrobacter portucalensis]|uniref:hypothetical protein n=1 Tax=Citrobacter portucalensis TaxID=1639133 RepID=UPI00226B344D|nr:hypothetical protein [Citrobacter portucalensis]MCX8980074.1 hypothetical protein [Citrobacter portucalensis]
MFRRNPQLRAADKWHKLLNNGNSFVLVDGNNKIYAAHREEMVLEREKRRRPTLSLRIVTILSFFPECVGQINNNDCVDNHSPSGHITHTGSNLAAPALAAPGTKDKFHETDVKSCFLLHCKIPDQRWL